MGTRGAVGFRLDGVDKIAYNHFDSYPRSLGREVIAFVLRYQHELPKLAKQVRALRLVSSDGKPRASTRRRCAAYFDIAEAILGPTWYDVLRPAQGRLDDYLALRYMPDAGEFIQDSLFCEWAYIVNLDDNVLEVYQGFQTEPHTLGRYGQAMPTPPSDWAPQYLGYPCALIAQFDISTLTPDPDAVVNMIALAEV